MLNDLNNKFFLYQYFLSILFGFTVKVKSGSGWRRAIYRWVQNYAVDPDSGSVTPLREGQISSTKKHTQKVIIHFCVTYGI